ncbi:restriction endonuclease subunit S [Anaerobiospirillum thomasii]|nr:restriction endonuclease subunit S [Anaerobiospirillum thomasii]
MGILHSRYLNDLGRGATFKEISKSIVEKIAVPAPPLEVQDKFISFIDQIDKSKFILQQMIEKLELLKKSRFIEMFDSFFKNEKSLYEIKKICNVIDYRGKTPEKSDTGIPLITAKNVKNNAFIEEPREFIPVENYEKIMTRGTPKVNDVLFTTEAPLGNVCRIPGIYNKFCVGQRLVTLQPNNLILSEYLEYALLSNIFQKKIWKNASGSTVKGIRSKLLVDLQIPVPPLRLQEEFKNLIYQVDKSKLVLQKALENLVGKV